MQGIDLLIGGDYSSEYIIPDIVHHQLVQPDGIAVSLNGPKENVRVDIIATDQSINLQEIAPEGATFSLSPHTLSDKTHTDIHRSHITIHPGVVHQDARAYSLLHGLGRLKQHQNPERHQRWADARMVLDHQLAALQAYGMIDASLSYDAIVAWRLIVEEERAASEEALRYHRTLLRRGVNILPRQTTTRALAAMVNSKHLLRTTKQIDISPDKTEKLLGLPMTLSEDRINEILAKNG